MIETLRDFVVKIGELNIEYMVTGSYAMSAYGEIRMTRDIDVVVQLRREDVKPFTKKFEADYYISEMSVTQAVGRQSMFNIISQQHGGKIDCIVMKDNDFDRQSFARRAKVKVSGTEFWSTTKEDLIISKLNWARETHSEMQIRDIANLSSTEYDSGYVDNWIKALQLDSIWEEVRSWKTQHQRQEN